MKQAVILAGGKGSRLAQRLAGRPKPLVLVDSVPLLERQMRALAAQGITETLVLVNHAADQVAAFLNGRDVGCSSRLIDDGNPRGTAGAVLACLDDLDSRALIVYGDTLFDIDLAAMVGAHDQANADATLFIHPNDHPADSDIVEIDDQGRITAFHSYPHPEGVDFRNLVNAAFYIVERRALEPWRETSPPVDFAKDLFPAMLARGAKLHGYVSFEYIKDLGTPERLDKAERQLRTGVVARAVRSASQPAVFLDRDGTLNEARGYITQPDHLVLIAGAAKAVRRFNDNELRAVLVSNQPVIARGECTQGMLSRIHKRLSARLGDAGGYLDAIYYCPHHPDVGFDGEVPEFKIVCNCRKPGIGMYQKAIADLNIAPERSWMVGDSTADMAAAATLGIASVLVRTGEGGRDGKYAIDPDFIVDDIEEAAKLITEIYPAELSKIASLLSALPVGALVLIGGPARGGKSTLAAVIRRELRRAGRTCERVSLDGWFRPIELRGKGVLDRYDLEAASIALEPWLAGHEASLSVPIYDCQAQRSIESWRLDLLTESVMVVEGVPALLMRWSTRRPVVRIHVEVAVLPQRQSVTTDLIVRGPVDAAADEQIEAFRELDELHLVCAAGASADIRLIATPTNAFK